MPNITKHFHIEITPEQFLKACDGTELQELQLLLSSPRYQEKIGRNTEAEIPDEDLPIAGPIPRELLDRKY